MTIQIVKTGQSKQLQCKQSRKRPSGSFDDDDDGLPGMPMYEAHKDSRDGFGSNQGYLMDSDWFETVYVIRRTVVRLGTKPPPHQLIHLTA
jgi:hypothetical protein